MESFSVFSMKIVDKFKRKIKIVSITQGNLNCFEYPYTTINYNMLLVEDC